MRIRGYTPISHVRRSKAPAGHSLRYLFRRGILILDEPTSGLDGKNMRLIAEKLKKAKKRQKLFLVITHDTEFHRRLL